MKKNVVLFLSIFLLAVGLSACSYSDQKEKSTMENATETLEESPKMESTDSLEAELDTLTLEEESFK